MEKTDSIETLDLEWVKLIMQAKDLGLKAEEVRFFLLEKQKKN